CRCALLPPEASLMTSRWLVPALIATVTVIVGPVSTSTGCPLCNPTGTTFASEVAQADLILYGTLSNRKQDPNDFNKGTTDLVIKPNDAVKGKKTITVPRYVPPESDGKSYKYLIFFNVVNGQLYPYRGEAFAADSNLPDYLKGAIEVRQKDTVTRLRYFFDYL